MSEVSEQTQAETPVSIESRISSYVASEDPPLDEQGYSTEAPTEDAQNDSGNDEGDQQASGSGNEDQAAETPLAEEFDELTWNGEKVKKSREEIKRLAEQGFDYTQKTQAVAEERKRLEADTQALRQSQAFHNALQEQTAEVRAMDKQLEQFKSLNWHELAEQDPVQYLKINQTYRDLKEARDAKVQEVQGVAQQFHQQQSDHMQQVVAREMQALANKIPEFSGEKKSESVAALRSYLGESGFSDTEIAGVIDHRAVTMAWKAMQYDKIQKAKPAEKKVQNLPKPVKPGMSPAKGQVQAEKNQQLRQQLRKTGKVPPGLLARFL